MDGFDGKFSENWHVYYRGDGHVVEPRRYELVDGTVITQDEIVDMLVRHFRSGRGDVVILEAPPGIGKSLIAMSVVASLLRPDVRFRPVGRYRAIFLVPVNVLGTQYEQDFEQRYELRVGSMVIPVRTIFGKNRYRCAKNPRYTVDMVSCRGCPLYEPVTSNVEQYRTGSVGNTADAISEYQCIAGTCYRVRRAFTQRCEYYARLDAYVDSPIIVTNPKKYYYHWLTGVLPQHEMLVIDEFDVALPQLLPILVIDEDTVDELASIANLKSNYEYRRLRSMLNQRNVDPSDVANQYKVVVEQARNILRSELSECRKKHCGASVDGRDICPQCADIYERYMEVLRLSRLVNEVMGQMYHAVSVRTIEGRLRVVVFPHNFTELVNNMLFKDRRVLLMSATPPPEDVFYTLTGVSPAKIRIPTSPPGRLYVLVTNQLYDVYRGDLETDPDIVYGAASAAAQAIAAASLWRPTLIHITARWFWERVKEALHQYLDIIGISNPNDIEDVDGKLLLAVRQGKADMVATTRATRGIDLPDVHSMVITKMPRPDINDPVLLYLKHRGGHRVASNYYRWLMVSSVYQMVTRPMRREDSWAVLVVHDEAVLAALAEIRERYLVRIEFFKAPKPGNVDLLVKLGLNVQVDGDWVVQPVQASVEKIVTDRERRTEVLEEKERGEVVEAVADTYSYVEEKLRQYAEESGE